MFRFQPPVAEKYEVCGQSGKLEYLPTECLGFGSNATMVHKGRFEGYPAAVKMIPRETFDYFDEKFMKLDMEEKDLNEAKLLRQYEHKNVIRYYLLDYDARFIYLGLELCVGNLAEYIESDQPEKLPSGNHGLIIKKHLLQGILEGLHYLHGADIIHGDLKPSNILLKRNKSPEVHGSYTWFIYNGTYSYEIVYDAVISDFGLSLKIDPGRKSKTAIDRIIGTEGWRPKEVIDRMEEIHSKMISVNFKEEYEMKLKGTKGVDVFALGCLIQYVMADKDGKKMRPTRMHPFGMDKYRDHNIQKGTRWSYLSKFIRSKNLDEVLADMLISICVDVNPQCRPETKEIKMHPFFWEPYTRYQFIEKVANEVVPLRPTDELVSKLNESWKKFHGWSYKGEISGAVDYLTKYSVSQNRSLGECRWCYLDSLLKDIRNIKQHYPDTMEKDGYQTDILSHLHEGSEEDFDRYFLQKIVQILPVVYTCFYKIPRDKLKAYRAYISNDTEPAIINLRVAIFWNTLEKIYDQNYLSLHQQRIRHRSIYT